MSWREAHVRHPVARLSDPLPGFPRSVPPLGFLICWCQQEKGTRWWKSQMCRRSRLTLCVIGRQSIPLAPDGAMQALSVVSGRQCVGRLLQVHQQQAESTRPRPSCARSAISPTSLIIPSPTRSRRLGPSMAPVTRRIVHLDVSFLLCYPHLETYHLPIEPWLGQLSRPGGGDRSRICGGGGPFFSLGTGL